MNLKLLQEKLKCYYRQLPAHLTSTQLKETLQLAHQLAQQGKVKQAAESYRQAADILAASGRFAEAEQICQQWIALQPRISRPYSNLGKVLTLQGKDKEASVAFREAVKQRTRGLHPENSNWHQAQPQGPDFFINGFARCGTTSLYIYLIKHPRILPCAYKEPMFFNKDYALGLDWYLSHFPVMPTEGNYLTGEATTRYIDHPQAAKRLYRHFPRAKFVIMMRNPVERTVSDYNLLVNRGVLKQPLKQLVNRLEKLRSKSEADLARWVQRWRLTNDPIASSLYVYHIERWLSLFSREQFLFLSSEDFYSEPAQTVQKVFRFLGLPDYELADYPQYNSGNYGAIALDVRAALISFFEPHNQKLEDKLGIKFNWRN